MQMGQAEAPVRECDVPECSYNAMQECHAPAIEVGDSQHAQCDTFTTAGTSQTQPQESHVGGCQVTVCTYNNSEECHAQSILVTHHQGHADCATYTPR